MKKLICGAVGVAVALVMTGCVFSRAPMMAPIVMDESYSENFWDNSVKATKSGTSEATGIILFAQGDASVSAAMKNGGITKIHHVDKKVQNIFGIVVKHTTTVWGE